MTQDEIIEMAQECRLIGMRPHLDGIYSEALVAFAKLVAEAERERIKQANAPEIEKINAYIEHAMREVQRLGQEIEQEPVPPPWWPAVENILNEYGLQAVDFVADFKNAMAQPEQEPVAWEQFYPDIGKPQLEMKVEGPLHVVCQCDKCKPQISFNAEVIGYVEPQRTWVGLTDEEIEGAIDDGFAFGLDDGNVSNEYVIRYARAIEQALKEKNT